MDAEQPTPAPSSKRRLVRAYVAEAGVYTNCLMGVSIFGQKPQPPAPGDEDDCKPDHVRGEKPS